jgi:hypothetical protein
MWWESYREKVNSRELTILSNDEGFFTTPVKGNYDYNHKQSTEDESDDDVGRFF